MSDDLDILVEEMQEGVPEEDIIQMGDEGWNELVLSKLRDNEHFDRKPRADGLVRLTREFYGGLSMSIDVHSCSPTYACVTVMIEIPDGSLFAGTAECSSDNTKHPFYHYPAATAETRALGRAAKRALGLVGINTAEEIGETPAKPSNDENRNEGLINSSQIRFIDRQSKKNNVNVREIVQHILADDVNNINEISYEEALKVNELLNDLRENDDLKKQFGEYDPDWKDTFFE